MKSSPAMSSFWINLSLKIYAWIGAEMFPTWHLMTAHPIDSISLDDTWLKNSLAEMICRFSFLANDSWMILHWEPES